MKNLLRNLTIAGALAAGFATLAPTQAEAKGVMVINTGEDFFETGPMPELATHENPEFRKLQAGYKCNVFGVFWAYFHTWDCEPVLFYKEGDTYNYLNDAETKALVTAKYSEKDIKMGVWAKHGRWAFAGIILLPLLFSIVRRVGRNKSA
jgi:hypothetical protein